MAWIFQGNPTKFDIDGYLARYPDRIYWRTPRFRTEIKVGDRTFIWRAATNSGIVASGEVVEAPVPMSAVQYPEALGDDLWVADSPPVNDIKVGIRLDSVRLTVEEGMLPREVVKKDRKLKESEIILRPRGTVFHLDPTESARVEKLWNKLGEGGRFELESVATEGALLLRTHWLRERSRTVIEWKLREFRAEHGSLHCELCHLEEDGRYPDEMAASVFEVHHITPLAATNQPIRTATADLLVLCANCHRAIHASLDVEGNTAKLRQAFGS